MSSHSLALALVFSGLLCAADQVVGGPYVVSTAPRSVTIGWVVQTSEIRVGENPSDLNRSFPVLRSEKVSLTGLKAGATIHYQSFPGEAGKGRFKAPPTGSAPFEFVVFGDTRTRHELHQRVIDAMIRHSEPDFVLHTGDLIQDGYNAAEWPTFFGIERELLRRTVFFPVLGNHERNNRRFYDFFDVTTPYYSFNWGNAHFVILDSDVQNWNPADTVRRAFWDEQASWLEQDLSKNKAAFTFVTMHHPPFTVNQRAEHMSKETPTLVPMFEKYGVTAVLAGHDHNYQHHVRNGIHYIVTGGGGAPLAETKTPLPNLTVKMESIEHFVPVKVNGKTARIQAIALDGRVIESIDLKAK
jgi:acid phosphatase type 7